MEQVFVQLQCCQLKSFDTEVYCSFADPISVLNNNNNDRLTAFDPGQPG